MEKSTRSVRFAGFELDLCSDELRKGGTRLKVPDQPIRVLKVLLERPGELVTRKELCERLWPADTVVDVEHGVNTAVRRLRAALGDSAESPRFIETLPRRGYRFVGTIAPVPHTTPAPTPPLTAADPSAAADVRAPGREADDAPPALAVPMVAQMGGKRPPWRIVGGAVLLGCASILATAWPWPQPDPSMQELPFTAYEGDEFAGRFSPDGREVVFTWAKPGERADVYIKALGSDMVLPFVSTPEADEAGPVFSPDGRLVAFLRMSADKSMVILKSREGGDERPLTQATTPHRSFVASPGPHLAWTPDGLGVIYSHRKSLWLWRLDVARATRLTTPPPTATRGDVDPALSPDGSTLVFTRDARTGSSDLYSLRLDPQYQPSGSPVVLHADGTWNRSPAWHPDGRRVLFVSGYWGRQRLHYLDIQRPGRSRPVPGISSDAHQPTLSPTTGDVLYTRWHLRRELFSIPLEGVAQAAGPPRRLFPSSRASNMARVSRDGSRIVFQSDRTGAFEVWTAGLDGRGLHRVTSFEGPPAGCPDISPDGRRIVFDHLVDRQRDIFVSDTLGAGLARLTWDPADDLCPRWSADGKSVYFASLRDGRLQIWRLTVETGHVQRVTSHGGMTAEESPDGAMLYFTQHDGRTPPVFAMPVSGGPPVQVVDAIRGQQMCATPEGLYYVPADAEGEIWFVDVASRARRRVATVPGGVAGPIAVDGAHRVLVGDSPGPSPGDLIIARAPRLP
jgi:Tol biopolymer transport system component/DNA-binding winged helix-turn-helix (wHTH) protein